MNNSLWGDLNLITNTISEPQDILVAQAKCLETGTNGLLAGKVSRYSFSANDYLYSDINPDFAYRFYIVSPYVEKYKYLACTIIYNIKFYPLGIIVNPSIAEELANEKVDMFDDDTVIVETQNDFEDILSKVLTTDEIRQVLTGLISLAKKENDKSGELPF